MGDHVLCSDPKRRKTPHKKLDGPRYFIPAVVTVVHTTGNFTAIDQRTQTTLDVMSTEAK